VTWRDIAKRNAGSPLLEGGVAPEARVRAYRFLQIVRCPLTLAALDLSITSRVFPTCRTKTDLGNIRDLGERWAVAAPMLAESDAAF